MRCSHCDHCGNDIPPERVKLGYNYCTTCAVFYTPERVVVPMGVATRPVAAATIPPKRVGKPRKKVANGRFQVTDGSDPTPRGFDNLDNAMVYAMTLSTPHVKDSQQGGIGQIWPTPDRTGGTHHVRWAKY